MLPYLGRLWIDAAWWHQLIQTCERGWPLPYGKGLGLFMSSRKLKDSRESSRILMDGSEARSTLFSVRSRVIDSVQCRRRRGITTRLTSHICWSSQPEEHNKEGPVQVDGNRSAEVSEQRLGGRSGARRQGHLLDSGLSIEFVGIL